MMTMNAKAPVTVSEAMDMIENSMAVVSFLRDVTGAPSVHQEITRDGGDGLSYILSWVNSDLGRAVEAIRQHHNGKGQRSGHELPAAGATRTGSPEGITRAPRGCHQ